MKIITDISNPFITKKLNEYFANIEYVDTFSNPKLYSQIFDLNSPINVLIKVNDDHQPLKFDNTNSALQIYFYFIQNNFYNFKIHLISFLNKSLFKLLYKNPNITKLKNIEFLEIKNEHFISDIKECPTTHINKRFFRELLSGLNELNLQPSSNYTNHHSISNLWSCVLWSKYIQPDASIHDEIFSMYADNLYFNYLLSRNHLMYQLSDFSNVEKNKLKKYFFDKEHKIYIISDNKEWKHFWKIYFTNVFKGVEYKFCEIDNNIQDKSMIKEKERVFNEIQEFNPDCIIVDLKLLKKDYYNLLSDVDDFKELLSFQIVRSVKENINRGIQILLFTAQNDIPTFNYFSLNVDGYIIKEFPEIIVSKNHLVYLNNLSQEVHRALNRKYLKSIYLNIQKCNSVIKKLFDDRVYKHIKAQFDISYDLLYNAQNEEQFAYAFIALHSVSEALVRNIYKEKNNNEIQIKIPKNILLKKFIKYNKNENKYFIEEYSKLQYEEKNLGMKFAVLYLFFYYKFNPDFNDFNENHHKELNNLYKFFNLRNLFIHNKDKIKPENHKLIYSHQGYEQLLEYYVKLLSSIEKS